jgi:hypothetical protein
MQGVSERADRATMKFLGGGSGKPCMPADPAHAKLTPPDTAQLFDDSAELDFCCICGALLWADPEDEIDGEGPGRDICGDCNRTKNYETMMGNE